MSGYKIKNHTSPTHYFMLLVSKKSSIYQHIFFILLMETIYWCTPLKKKTNLP